VSGPVDVLVLAAHPDDAEIGCGGTIMALLEAGRQVALVDMTQGEMGTRGSPEERAAECAKATAMLGVGERRNLRLPDAGLKDDDEALWAVIEVLRELRPRLFLVPLIHDAHPDHEATGRIARRAFFLTGLKNYHPELGTAHRPSIMLSYFGNDYQDPPSFCVDIGPWVERKREVVSCYTSQVGGKDKSHFLRGLDPLDRTEARDRFFGANCGYRAAEPFVHDGPIPLADLSSFLPPAP
jgi:bacillithiol biosynthesis deacetylase BshB1